MEYPLIFSLIVLSTANPVPKEDEKPCTYNAYMTKLSENITIY